ncbi:hypothetical protein Glove_139g299 [Diversispora epigaea]|uniref:Ion transport domain-containing protein n=1 Tax=Diversispora epigaea TaxID=1348612 RepID=A0A397IVD5_9GLOM|nr:hypothetical protein Glove_139g299 [Diversispora epigaea]
MSKKQEETFSLTSFTEKDSLFFGSCIAISPDSQQIVTFSPETHEFKLYDVDDLSSSKPISTLESGINGKYLCWSIAISNCVEDGKNERFIALSCFDVRGLRNDIMHVDDENDLESGDKYLRPQTWVISTTDKNETYTSPIGGVIRFLDSDDSSLKNKTVIIVVDASEIYKETMNNIKRKRFFSRSPNIERFELPQQLSIRLHISRDHWQNSLELLHTSIIKNHFMVHSFKDRQQIIEMLFKRHESSLAPNIIHGSPIFAISQNEKILGFCRGTTSITLYFMENGLEIATKQLEGQRGIYKIVAINFIDDDSKLLIVLEEKEVEILRRQIFVVWDLFTTFENSIRQIDYSETQPLKMDITHRLMNSHGKIFAVRDSGNILSVLDHKDVALIRNPSAAKTMTKIDIVTGDHVYRAIYNIDGEKSDTSKLAKKRIIINNVEPWHPNKSYFRTSVYLDSTESTQLIISKYIWARKKAIDVQELRIGEREFVVKVSVPSSMTIHWPNNANVLEGACQALYVLEEKKNIVAGHENVNQIKYLIECTQRLVQKYITKYGIFRLTSIRYPIMKYLIKSYQESLINDILNKKINKKNSNIYIPRSYKWIDEDISLTNEPIISPIIINGQEENDFIAISKKEDEGKNKEILSKTDLHHAILCIQGRGDSVILKYLIDYYADNTKEYNNYGWMFTVSKAIPLLYDNNLREFVQYLFKKPCFGITEAYTPPLHINSHDQRKGNNADVIYSLAVKPRLASKPHNTLWFFLKNLFTRKWFKCFYRIETSHDDRKVYIVPLPDFTVYPPNLKGHEDRSKWFWIVTFFRIFFWPRRKVIHNTKKMSPFLRVIHEEKGYEIYQTPTIMAILGFKWSTARRYYIHHIIMYLLFATAFTLEFENVPGTIFTIFVLVRMYTGLYLIVTEIVQLKREGWHRYKNIYHVFDLGSVLLPTGIFIVNYLFNSEKISLKLSDLIAAYAFTDLVIWLEALFLLRYFEGPGRFVYIIISILNTIWPFFAFMLSAIVAFGHAMFILLRYDDSRFQNTIYKFNDTSNGNGLYSNITIYQDVDTSSRLDNYYSHFYSSVEAVFFWTNGRWDQLDQWDYLPVDAMSILGSIILVLIFQNMLIAFMNGAFDKANKEGRTAAHRYRIERIAEYEALEKPFSRKSNPRYIYYIPDPDMIDTWLEETKKNEEQKLRLMGENLAELTDLTDFDYSDDDDNNYHEDSDDDNYHEDGDDDDDDNQDNSKKYRHIKNEGSLSTMDLDSIEPITTKYNSIIDKISFIDEEIFSLKVTPKLKKKSQRNWKSNNKLLKNDSYNESLSPTTNVDDQLSMQELKTRIDEIDQNLKKLMKTLNNLNNNI